MCSNSIALLFCFVALDCLIFQPPNDRERSKIVLKWLNTTQYNSITPPLMNKVRNRQSKAVWKNQDARSNNPYAVNNNLARTETNRSYLAVPGQDGANPARATEPAPTCYKSQIHMVICTMRMETRNKIGDTAFIMLHINIVGHSHNQAVHQGSVRQGLRHYQDYRLHLMSYVVKKTNYHWAENL